MPRDDDRNRERSTRNPDVKDQDTSDRGRDRDAYRDGDDVREPPGADERMGTSPDTRNEARGDARENVGNTAHDQVGRSDA